MRRVRQSQLYITQRLRAANSYNHLLLALSDPTLHLALTLSLSLLTFVYVGTLSVCSLIRRPDTPPGIGPQARGDRSFPGSFIGADACRTALRFFARWFGIGRSVVIRRAVGAVACRFSGSSTSSYWSVMQSLY